MLLLCAGFCPLAASEQNAASKPASFAIVPFVGCASDGQVGPLPAPRGKGRRLAIAPELAKQLAYFKAKEGPGVLAPRGWHCFGIYGSNGSSLFVSPEPLDADRFFGRNAKGFSSDVIELSISIGDTSGRFEVAKIIARVFPARRTFVDGVIHEGLEPASSFPFGPFPKDKLTYKGKSIVEYETPAQCEGLGTQSRLLKNDAPIRGVEVLSGSTPDLISLSMRLPANLDYLALVVIRSVEGDVQGSHSQE
jgi:hypothetical protein